MLSFRPGPNGTWRRSLSYSQELHHAGQFNMGGCTPLSDQQGAPGCQLSQHGDKYRWTGANYPWTSRTYATIAKQQMEHAVYIRYTITPRIGGSALAWR
jgi:hypothetical protein